MGKNNIVHLLPSAFYRDMNLFFQGMGQRTIDYIGIINGANNLAGMAIKDGAVIANHTIPQEALELAHDELVAAMDDRLFCLAHLVKINNYVPYISQKLGDVIIYEDPDTQQKKTPNGEWENNIYCRMDFSEACYVRHHNKTQTLCYWMINTKQYLQLPNLLNEMEVIVNQAYPALRSIRMLMSNKTQRNREDNIYRDPFCTEFLYGKDITADDAKSRIEYQYFIRNNITLGLFPTHPKVAQWLSNERKKASRCERVIDYLKKRETGVIIPGIYVPKDQNATSDIVRQFSRNVAGIIPAGGLYIGDVQQKPERNLLGPRLAYQRQG